MPEDENQFNPTIKLMDEENPFENPEIAAQWATSVEGESGMFRDTAIYPRLASWIGPDFDGTVVEVGSGQGICSTKLNNYKGKYIGVEPSKPLTERAQQLYPDQNRKFVVGGAYDIPVETESTDAAMSVMVWFHLENIAKASQELARILKPGGKFLIITANMRAKETWKSFFVDATQDGNKIVGKVNVPVNPLSKNIIHQHTEEEIVAELQKAGLTISRTEEFGTVDENQLFLLIEGTK